MRQAKSTYKLSLLACVQLSSLLKTHITIHILSLTAAAAAGERTDTKLRVFWVQIVIYSPFPLYSPSRRAHFITPAFFREPQNWSGFAKVMKQSLASKSIQMIGNFF